MTPRAVLLAALVAASLLPAAVGQAQRIYSVENRALYISQGIAGLRGSRPEVLRNLYKYIYTIERNGCRAPTEIMRVDCLLEAARQNCKQRDSARAAECERISDVVITARVSEREFVPRAVAHKIMKSWEAKPPPEAKTPAPDAEPKGKAKTKAKAGRKAPPDAKPKVQSDARSALLAELRGRYAELVIEMSAEAGDDRYITDSTLLPKTIDAYCVSHAPPRKLTWEQCAAAIVWFIGTSGKASDGPIEVSK